jgi:hypothetical protein
MHASGRCLRDAAGKGLFFVQIFGLFLFGAVPDVPQIIYAGRFLRDATGDALSKSFRVLRQGFLFSADIESGDSTMHALLEFSIFYFCG